MSLAAERTRLAYLRTRASMLIVAAVVSSTGRWRCALLV